jgi:thymidylate synthase
MNNIDKQYTELLQDILNNGVKKQDRTGTGTISVFGRQIRHKMSEGFPLLTTKKMPFKTMVTELLWFLRGDTNIKYLVDNNCHIWDGDAYKNYTKYPLATIHDHHTNILYQNRDKGWCMLNGRSTVSPHPTRHLTQEEFINKIKTDDEFAKKWGELGPVYGKQWRAWDTRRVDNTNIKQNRRDGIVPGLLIIDQIKNLINDLKTNPDSRRLMVNAWNVGELDQMVLPPCHYGFQVYTRELNRGERVDLYIKKYGDIGMDYVKYKDTIPSRAISLMWNQRSVDVFLGLPFNIASYGLLLEIIAKEVNMIPDELIGNLGDTHLYLNHIEQAKEQIGRELSEDERYDIHRKYITKDKLDLVFEPANSENLDKLGVPKRTREPYPLPTITLPSSLQPNSGNWDKLVFEDFYLNQYQSHSPIKAKLSN